MKIEKILKLEAAEVYRIRKAIERLALDKTEVLDFIYTRYSGNITKIINKAETVGINKEEVETYLKARKNYGT